MIDRKKIERWRDLASREPDFHRAGCDARIRELATAVLDLIPEWGRVTGNGDDGQKKTIYVYVAGPLTGSGLEHENVRRAIDVAQALASYTYGGASLVPYVPHLMAAQWAVRYEEHEDFWLDMCFAWVERCDTMIVIPGESPGTEKEIELAGRLGKKVHRLGPAHEFGPMGLVQTVERIARG